MSAEHDAALQVLSKADVTLSQLMQALAVLEKGEYATRRSIGISSSVTMELLGAQLKRQGFLAGVRIDVHAGNYDDPVGDAERFVKAGVEELVLWPFFDNLLPSFEAQVGTLSAAAIDAKESELRERYRLALETARPMRAVYLGTFHRLLAAAEPGARDVVAAVLARFDAALREVASAFPNVKFIDSQELVISVGRAQAFDWRFYFRGKAPYTAGFLGELARRIGLASRNFGTKFYKVLVLDCDNTLWGGVIGEDLLAGIKLGPHDAPGSIFWRMQHEFSALEKSGVVLCLCSKNNAADVDEVFQKHPSMVLRDDQLVLKKVNWDDKPSNLRAIAKELNLGLDSFVFVDDSSFEIEAVRQQLPMVKTIQVPSTLSEYPAVARQLRELFLAGGVSAESRSKTEQYRQRASAETAKAGFDSHEAYLKSLELKVELSRNARASLPRISELSLKSNQFNLTTKRYAEAEVTKLMDGPNTAVYSLVVADKFGVAGLTGIAVVRYEAPTLVIENFLMSCRVIGRGVEMSVWAKIVADAQARGCTELRASFVPSAKNAQVADFFDRLGLPLLSQTDSGERHYGLAAKDFRPPDSSWIELTYVE